MSSKRRGCINDPDIFCYICGSFVPSVQRQNITPFVKHVCYAYFRVKLGDQCKVWAPHKVCRNCVSSLRQWSIEKLRSLAFGVPMVWTYQMDMAKKVTFAHELLLASMFKISIKFNTLTCLVPYDPFLMAQVTQFHYLHEFWKQLKILLVRSLCLIASRQNVQSMSVMMISSQSLLIKRS